MRCHLRQHPKLDMAYAWVRPFDYLSRNETKEHLCIINYISWPYNLLDQVTLIYLVFCSILRVLLLKPQFHGNKASAFRSVSRIRNNESLRDANLKFSFIIILPVSCFSIGIIFPIGTRLNERKPLFIGGILPPKALNEAPQFIY